MLTREIEARLAFHAFGYTLYEHVKKSDNYPPFVLAFPTPFFDDRDSFNPPLNTWQGISETDTGCAPAYLRPENLSTLLDKLFYRHPYAGITRGDGGAWIVTYTVPPSLASHHTSSTSLNVAVSLAILRRLGVADDELRRLFGDGAVW